MKVTNRFKGLDFTGRVPEELWTEVHYMYGRQWSTPSTRKRNAKKTKWLSEEALQRTLLTYIRICAFSIYWAAVFFPQCGYFE